jgi:hypothetical protein
MLFFRDILVLILATELVTAAQPKADEYQSENWCEKLLQIHSLS